MLQGEGWKQFTARLEKRIAKKTNGVLGREWLRSDEKETDKRHNAQIIREALLWALSVPERAIEKERTKKEEKEDES